MCEFLEKCATQPDNRDHEENVSREEYMDSFYQHIRGWTRKGNSHSPHRTLRARTAKAAARPRAHPHTVSQVAPQISSTSSHRPSRRKWRSRSSSAPGACRLTIYRPGSMSRKRCREWPTGKQQGWPGSQRSSSSYPSMETETSSVDSTISSSPHGRRGRRHSSGRTAPLRCRSRRRIRRSVATTGMHLPRGTR